jgi:hypothetical protein
MLRKNVGPFESVFDIRFIQFKRLATVAHNLRRQIDIKLIAIMEHTVALWSINTMWTTAAIFASVGGTD